MSSPRVRADYDSLAAIARTFGHEAANARQTLRHLRRQMEVLQSGDWIGRGATAFYQEMNGAVLPSLQRLVTALEVAERAAAKISALMRAAEEEASAILRSGIDGGGATTMGGVASTSGAEDDDIFADVYAALDREGAGGAGDEEDIFAGVNISGVPGGGASDAGGADVGPAAGPASPDAPSGGGSGDRRRGQGGVGGVGGASLGGGQTGPETNPFAGRGSPADGTGG